MPNQAVVDFIEKYDKFIITAHETPDGDALGSEYAMLLALKRLGKQARILNADPAPKKFAFVDKNGDFEVLLKKEQIPDDIGEYGLFILDVNDINNIGAVRDVVLPGATEYLIIDHHEDHGTLAEKHYIRGEASSTCEILFGIFETLHITITKKMAIALYAGIDYDTGSFAYPKTSANTFRIARLLVEAGVNPNFVYSKL